MRGGEWEPPLVVCESDARPEVGLLPVGDAGAAKNAARHGGKRRKEETWSTRARNIPGACRRRSGEGAAVGSTKTVGGLGGRRRTHW
jgi:hypothetical protein